MVPIDALLFDLDGTLIDSATDIANSVRALQKHFHFKISNEKEVASFIGDGVVKLVQRALPGIKNKYLSEALAHFKRHYRLHALEHTCLYPGVRETLFHFRHKPMAIVTNKPARISRLILDALGLNSFFPVLVGGDSLRFKKPDPEPIYFALSSLKIANPSRVLMVGDSPHDVCAGRNAGTRTCGIISNIASHELLKKSSPDLLLATPHHLLTAVC